MFMLQAPDGSLASGKYGPFVYGTRRMAEVASKILGKRDGIRYKVIPA